MEVVGAWAPSTTGQPPPDASPVLSSLFLPTSTGLPSTVYSGDDSSFGVPSDQSLPFRDTHLFSMVMKVLSSSASNSSASLAAATAVGAESTTPGAGWGWSEETRFVFVIALGTIFSILTIVGNLMVMVSFKIDKQLQTITNYFLFSLAVADITIGMISIPMFTYYTAMNKWDIGYTLCQFWLCIDYLMSNASVLNLLLISFDRYFSITLPLSYRPRRTTRKAIVMIATTYIISMILWPPWIISWPYIEGKFTVGSDECVVQFLTSASNSTSNSYVTIGTAVAAFYLPVSIMIILYTRVYFETQKRQKEFGQLQASRYESITWRTASVVAIEPGTATGSEKGKGVAESSRAHSLPKKFPSRAAIKRDPSTSSLVKSSGSVRKHDWSSQKKPSIVSRTSKRCSWFQKCMGKSPHSSSEDSSEAAVLNVDDTSMSSSLYAAGKKKPSPPCSPMPPNDETASAETQADSTPRNGSQRFRSRTDKADRNGPADTYTVLIELKDEGARPVVRLSNNTDSPSLTDSPRRDSRGRARSDCNNHHQDILPSMAKRNSSAKESPAKNGRLLSKVSANDRKSEKERKKNERKQESKAAKTLSAILFVFICTWTPYNLLVCWGAIYSGDIPQYLWTISYFLCYINSTVNPLCYALSNQRFRKSYMRILRCQFKAERPQMNHGYLRR